MLRLNHYIINAKSYMIYRYVNNVTYFQSYVTLIPDDFRSFVFVKHKRQITGPHSY